MTMAKADAQTALRMPEDLHRRLSKAAEAAGHSLGEEMRRRLDRSFALSADAETGQLLAQIAHAAKLIGDFWSPWHSGRQAFDTFMGAVKIFAERQKPSESIAVESNKMFDGGPDDAERLVMVVDLFGEQP
jgi:hypothetical protein